MAKDRKLPIGIQSFEKLRNDHCIYIDKTRQINELVQKGCAYFLSRPRRFGKSLLITTLQAAFEGKRELFKGLYLDTCEDWDWTPRPVLHLDLNTEEYQTAQSLRDVLNEQLCKWEIVYGRNEAEKGLGRRFQGIIERAYQQTGHRVVILVDEYDKPMLQAIGKEELQQAFRSTLKGFYGALKSMDACIKFAMLTGVTKFGKVSVFSDLNNLRDISMDKDFYDICGITEKELLDNFPTEIDQLAQANEMTHEECIAQLREQYDGYHFEETAPGMYNPFSVLNTFAKEKFGSYWFQTGTPTYLVTLLQLHDYNLENMSQVETDADTLNSVDIASTDPIPVIYQSGYLTIKDYDKEFQMYRLGFPNREVEVGFMKFLLPYYTSTNQGKAAFDIRSFVLDVRAGQTKQFMNRLKSLFADTPYELIKDLENHYQNVLWLVTKLMGFYVQAEYRTSEGRIDLVLQAPKFCYVMEFKLDGTAEEAIEQISDKSYTLPFEMNGQQIIRVGVNFSSKTRNIEDIIVR